MLVEVPKFKIPVLTTPEVLCKIPVPKLLRVMVPPSVALPETLTPPVPVIAPLPLATPTAVKELVVTIAPALVMSAIGVVEP
jgi:hypothetical protein